MKKEELLSRIRDIIDFHFNYILSRCINENIDDDLEYQIGLAQDDIYNEIEDLFDEEK